MTITEMLNLSKCKGNRGFFKTIYAESMKVIELINETVFEKFYTDMVCSDYEDLCMLQICQTKDMELYLEYQTNDTDYSGYGPDVSTHSDVDFRGFYVWINVAFPERINFWALIGNNHWYQDLRRTEFLQSIFGESLISNDAEKDNDCVSFSVSIEWFKED